MLTSRDDQVDLQSHIQAAPDTPALESGEDYRCKCGKLLFRGELQMGSISIKCRRCRYINTFTGTLSGDTAELSQT